jgi:transposase
VTKNDQIKYLIEQNKAFSLKIIELEKEIIELKRRLDLNSGNSGKPPSSDGLSKPPRVQSLREKSHKKSGGQIGHKGTTLNQVKNPDKIETHKILQCPDCKTDLTNTPATAINKKQIFDIPEIKSLVTEHQFEVKYCLKCKKKVKAQEHGFAKTPVQYGPKSNAIATYLNVHNLVPEKRTTQIMKDVFSLPMSVATLEKITKTCAKKVKHVVEEIKEKLKNAPVKGADESGFRINNKTNWLHTLCNNQFVHYRASEKRGDILVGIKGIVVHDYFASYFSKLENVKHAMCNAHHLRELKAVKEIDKEPWAKHLSRLLLIGKSVTRVSQSIDTYWLIKFKKLYDHIISKALDYHETLGVLNKPKRGRVKRRPGHNLLLRLKNRSDDVLRFLYDPQVPFTNNQSEQALRMLKVKQKVSGCFRTFKGADNFFEIKSYSATAQKQGHNIFQALNAAFHHNPLLLHSSKVPE